MSTRFSHENEFYRRAVVFARYQPGTFTLENAISYASAQNYYDAQERNFYDNHV